MQAATIVELKVGSQRTLITTRRGRSVQSRTAAPAALWTYSNHVWTLRARRGFCPLLPLHNKNRQPTFGCLASLDLTLFVVQWEQSAYSQLSAPPV